MRHRKHSCVSDCLPVNPSTIRRPGIVFGRPPLHATFLAWAPSVASMHGADLRAAGKRRSSRARPSAGSCALWLQSNAPGSERN